MVWVLIAAGILVVLCLIPLLVGIPADDPVLLPSVPFSLLPDKSVAIEIQGRNQCAAFSAAYVMRAFGTDSKGEHIYREMPGKLPGGLVTPAGVLSYFRRNGRKAVYLRGSLDRVKAHLAAGDSVILFVRVFPDRRYLHFVPVIGYDEEKIYLAESLDFLVNVNDNPYYNRTVPGEMLARLWKLPVPFPAKTYVVISGERSS